MHHLHTKRNQQCLLSTLHLDTATRFNVPVLVAEPVIKANHSIKRLGYLINGWTDQCVYASHRDPFELPACLCGLNDALRGSSKYSTTNISVDLLTRIAPVVHHTRPACFH